MASHPLPLDADQASIDWREIEDLLDGIAQASKSDVSASEFYRLLLDRIVPAVGASGGAVWTGIRQGELCLEYQVDLAGSQRASSHELLGCHQPHVEDILRTGEPRIVPPGEPTNNQANGWLILHPFHVRPQTSGVIELVQRREMTAAMGRGYLRLLAAIVELIEDFHRNRELGELRRREQTWRQYERFAERVHHSLDVNQTAFLIANDGRTLIGCDRLSVLVRHGTTFRTTAISGVDALDRRAKVVRKLEQLVARCVVSGEPVSYCDGSADLPDEIEQPLQAYLDESHARAVAIVPLRESAAAGDFRPAPIIGVIVAEKFQASASDAELRQSAMGVAVHCTVALNNALTHSSLPLASLGRMLAGVGWLTQARQLPKTVLGLMAAAAVAAGLTLIPADFDIEAEGELQPSHRRDVFASDDGVVHELLVDHGRSVHAGEPLVMLRKMELDLEFRRIAGEMQTAAKELTAIQAERLENAPPSPDTRRNSHQLTADEEELKERLKGLAEQHEILERQRSDLIVRSPMDGQILTWDLKQLLEARPVQRGQALLTVADLDGPWGLELHVPDHRSGHVVTARDELRRDLEVSFALASEPGTVYQGRIADMALSTELSEPNGPTALVTVDFDRRDVVGLRPGATVIAQVHCGRRAVGYVWLHDLFEFVQSRWWW